MNDMKDDDEMVERDGGSSSDTTESEDMIDADAELDDLPDSDDENQSLDGTLDGTLPLNEAEEGENGHNGDKIVHMANEEHKLDRFGSPPNDGTTDETSSDDDVNGDGGLDNSENDEEDEIGEHRAVESIPDTNPVESKREELKNEVNAAAAVAVAAEGRIAVEENNGSLKEEPVMKLETVAVERPVTIEGSNQWIPLEEVDGNDTGTEEEQVGFMKELENFHKEKCLEFKPPKFYGEGLNCLKLWRQVTRLGGYDRVTSCKLWRQVGESFKPPKTCTTVSWSFRIFYEKALLEYERHKVRGGELHIPDSSHTEHIDTQSHQPSGSGRARRDAAARAMQGWHSQRLLGNGEVGDPIIKDKNSISMSKREKQLKSVGLLKRKKPSSLERVVKAARTITKAAKPQLNDMVSDIGPAADWVKINVRRTKDCFEVYALVPGLLREEVRVQSDPAGRLVISGDPEQPDNPWGVTPFKKVISLPSRIDPHQTSAVVTLHGQLFVRVPFEQTDM